ncbi:MAG: hypothetical protein ACRCWS_05650, partial [Propionibacteriaceae bacterium]
NANIFSSLGVWCVGRLGIMYRELTADDLRDNLGLRAGYSVDGFIAWGASNADRYELLDTVLAERGETSRRLADQGVLSHIAEFALDGKTYWFSVGYGGAMLSEIAHLACLFGSKANLCLGSCGGLAQGQHSMDVIVPTASYATESSAHGYVDARDNLFPASEALSLRLIAAIPDIYMIHRGPTMTCQAFLGETWDDICQWSEAGYLGVEMEAATIFAVSQHFDVPATALLSVADNLIEQETVFSESYHHDIEARSHLMRDMLTAALDVLVDPQYAVTVQVSTLSTGPAKSVSRPHRHEAQDS